MKERMSGYNGYFTVELALLFPVIFSVLVLIIYTAFFVHDRAVLDSVAYEAALRGSGITYEKADIEGKTRHEAQELLKNRLFITRDVRIEVKVDPMQVKVICSGNFRIPSGLVWAPELRRKGRHIEVEGKAARLNPGQLIRDTRMLENIAKIGGRHGDKDKERKPSKVTDR